MTSGEAEGRPATAGAGPHPGCFAAVMATGIVSQAMHLIGAGVAAVLLLAAAIAVYAVFAAGTAWRLAARPREVLADAADPGQMFAFFTFAAASDVLAARLAAGHGVAAAALLVAGGAGWLVFSCSVPAALARWQGPPPALAKADGTWFLWAVGTASVSVALSLLAPRAGTAARAAATAWWAAAVVLYLVIACLVVRSLLRYPRGPAELTPPYWIFMGGSAICVLAGALLLRAHDPAPGGAHGVIAAVSAALWAFGTSLIPVLLAAGIWRHVLRRVPLRSEPALWSIVFPAGMDAVASRELGAVLGVPWLTFWGGVEAWLALAAWAAVTLARAAAVAAWALDGRRGARHRHGPGSRPLR